MRRLKIISIVMLLSIVALLPKSNAALVSKPGTNALTNVTVSESYLYCQGMKGLGESLYGAGSNVQPHLATNKDWGAVSYLSNSIYGTNTAGQNKGLEVTIDGKEYYSTNGNTSGVMNWGYRWNFTSGIVEAYMNLENTSTSTAHNYVIELENAAKDSNKSKYVEVIGTKNGGFTKLTSGMALSEIMNFSFVSLRAAGIHKNYPVTMRTGLFGFYAGTDSGYQANGNRGAYTFRPVVWN